MSNETLKKLKFLSVESAKKLYFLNGINRAIIPSHVTKICKSLEKMGCIRPVIVASMNFIDGVRRTYVIDGQHLSTGLIRMGMDIPYIEIPIKDARDMIEHLALLNASSKSWTMDDYVLSWSYLEEDYRKLKNLKQVYDMDTNVLASIMMGLSGNAGGESSKKIKHGNFRIVNEKENMTVLDYLKDVILLLPRENRFRDRFVCSEFVKYYRSNRTYDHERFIYLLNKNKEMFRTVAQEEGSLLEQFQKLK